MMTEPVFIHVCVLCGQRRTEDQPRPLLGCSNSHYGRHRWERVAMPGPPMRSGIFPLNTIDKHRIFCYT